MDLKDSRRLPAFPTGIDTDQAGMTLRDYFAAQALCGLMANSGANDGVAQNGLNGVAFACYGLADAMLKARVK